MKLKWETTDPDIIGSWPAINRASKKAFALAKATNTPFYIWRNGKVVNLNPRRKTTRRKKSK